VAPGGGRRLVLHVGLHKTGTTYLQNVLRANRAALAAQGVWVPVPDVAGVPSATMAAWDLRGRRSERSRDRRQVGQWDALCSAAARSPMPVALVSAESLSLLTRRQASRALAGFADRSPTVVVTCRDLGRVLVSGWQESVKNGAVEDWSTYVARVRDREARGRDPGRGFWLNHDLPAVLDVWGHTVPTDRLVVVTLPPAGAPAGTLLARFAEAVGFDPSPLDTSSARANPGLGVAGTEVVRRLNVRLGRRLNGRQQDHVVRHVVVGGLRAADDAREGLPAEELPWLTGEARRTVAAVRHSGARVVGDLDDLRPRPDPRARRPGSATDRRSQRPPWPAWSSSPSATPGCGGDPGAVTRRGSSPKGCGPGPAVPDAGWTSSAVGWSPTWPTTTTSRRGRSAPTCAPAAADRYAPVTSPMRDQVTAAGGVTTWTRS